MSNTSLPYLIQCENLVRTDFLKDDNSLDIRCMYLQAGHVAFGIILQETIDSFLVGAGSRLIMDEDKTISVLVLGPMGVIRIFKSGMNMMSAPTDMYKYHYYKFLSSEFGGVKILPSLIQGVVLEEILEYTRKYEAENLEEDRATAPKIVKKTLSEDYAAQGIAGVSDMAFNAYTQSKKAH
jgi:hypothetical protein